MTKRESNMTKAFAAALVLVFILVLIIIFRKPNPEPIILDRSKELLDSIAKLTKKIEVEKEYTELYKNMADSLLSLPPKIKILYYEKKQFVSKATINQLDSIIRTSSGISVRSSH